MSDPTSSSHPMDRRAFRRATLDRPVLVTSTRTHTARTVNVSGGGLALRTTEDLSLGSRVSVYFELPIGFGVETDAEVIRREGDVFVVRFVEAPAQSVLAIRSFCRLSGIMPKVGIPAP
jgi:hypothetical protein